MTSFLGLSPLQQRNLLAADAGASVDGLRPGGINWSLPESTIPSDLFDVALDPHLDVEVDMEALYQTGMDDPSVWNSPGAESWLNPDNIALAGMILEIGGALTGAVGAFFAADAQKDQLKSQAMAAEHQQNMAAINARNAEREADAIMRDAERDIARVTMRAGAEKSARRASLAAGGIRLGVGTAAEIQATGDLLKEMDVYTVNSNAVRASNAARLRAVDIRNQGRAAGVSARNLFATSASLSPGVSAGTSLLSSAGRIARQWASDRRLASYGGGVS